MADYDGPILVAEATPLFVGEENPYRDNFEIPLWNSQGTFAPVEGFGGSGGGGGPVYYPNGYGYGQSG